MYSYLASMKRCALACIVTMGIGSFSMPADALDLQLDAGAILATFEVPNSSNTLGLPDSFGVGFYLQAGIPLSSWLYLGGGYGQISSVEVASSLVSGTGIPYSQTVLNGEVLLGRNFTRRSKSGIGASPYIGVGYSMITSSAEDNSGTDYDEALPYFTAGTRLYLGSTLSFNASYALYGNSSSHLLFTGGLTFGGSQPTQEATDTETSSPSQTEASRSGDTHNTIIRGDDSGLDKSDIFATEFRSQMQSIQNAQRELEIARSSERVNQLNESIAELRLKIEQLKQSDDAQTRREQIEQIVEQRELKRQLEELKDQHAQQQILQEALRRQQAATLPTTAQPLYLPTPSVQAIEHPYQRSTHAAPSRQPEVEPSDITSDIPAPSRQTRTVRSSENRIAPLRQNFEESAPQQRRSAREPSTLDTQRSEPTAAKRRSYQPSRSFTPSASASAVKSKPQSTRVYGDLSRSRGGVSVPRQPAEPGAHPGWRLRLAEFNDYATAAEVVARVTAEGFKAFIESGSESGVYVVRIEGGSSYRHSREIVQYLRKTVLKDLP